MALLYACVLTVCDLVLQTSASTLLDQQRTVAIDSYSASFQFNASRKQIDGSVLAVGTERSRRKRQLLRRQESSGCEYDGEDCETFAPTPAAPKQSLQSKEGRETSGSCADGCERNRLGDGICDPLCDNEACNFDNADCATTPAPTPDVPTPYPTPRYSLSQDCKVRIGPRVYVGSDSSEQCSSRLEEHLHNVVLVRPHGGFEPIQNQLESLAYDLQEDATMLGGFGSNIGGFQSVKTGLDLGSSAFQYLADAVCALQKCAPSNFTVTRHKRPSEDGPRSIQVPDLRISQLWLNINHPQNWNRWHRHSHNAVAHVSSVLFVRLPDGAPGTRYKSGQIYPRIGDVAFFPPHFDHMVDLNDGHTDRISIAFDFGPDNVRCGAQSFLDTTRIFEHDTSLWDGCWGPFPTKEISDRCCNAARNQKEIELGHLAPGRVICECRPCAAKMCPEVLHR